MGDSMFHNRYINFMQEYGNLGHMSIVNESIAESKPLFISRITEWLKNTAVVLNVARRIRCIGEK